jgi:hypothetical protein
MLVWQNRSPSVVQLGTNAQPARQTDQQPRTANFDRPDQLAADADYSRRIQPAATGYLGVRYIALTQGITAFEPDYQGANAGGDSFSDEQQMQPATAGTLMNELLPSSTGTPRPRS